MADTADAPNDSHAGATRALRRGAAISAVGEAGVLVVGVVGSIVIARYLGPGDRGLLAVIPVVAIVGVSLLRPGPPAAAQHQAAPALPPTRTLIGNCLLIDPGLGAVA